MASLDSELSKLFLLLMSTSGSFGSQNGSTLPDFCKQKLETSFIQHESKIEDSLQFFPDKKEGIFEYYKSQIFVTVGAVRVGAQSTALSSFT